MRHFLPPHPLLLLLLLLLPASAEESLIESESRAERNAALLRTLAATLAPECFASEVDATLPPSPGQSALLPLGHGIFRVLREGVRGRERASGEACARAWRAFVAGHGEGATLFFKWTGPGESSFQIVGEGLWTRGKAHIDWSGERIARLEIVSLDTLASDGPLFREVGEAAGLRGEDPAVLDHPTLGLAAYGAAAADVDGDGWIDLLSTRHDGNSLFRNRGDGTFETIEVASPRQATGALFVDVDQDGDPDLFLSCNGKQMLLRNRFVPEGKIGFTDVSEAAGVAVASIAFSIAGGDVNGDGFVDLYVTAYNNYGPVAPDSWVRATNGLPNLLFVNRGDGTFREEAAARGVAGRGWSYAAQFCDIDGDGRLDLYVANDFGGGNNLYLNCGDQPGDQFVDAALAYGLRDDGYGMGVAFSDFDADGLLDLHVTKMSSTAGNRILDTIGEESLRPLAKGNSLYRNLGDGQFAEVAAFPSGWAWGGGFIDVDNDGFEEVHSPNGFLSGASVADT